MASFIELEDSPMFHKQISSLEQTSDELNNRCQRLCEGFKKFMEALGRTCSGETAFADCLDEFSGAEDDPISMAIGGPIISKFVTAFRELATFKELLRSQVEHVLIDRLMQFMTVDLQNAKECRQRFDKSTYAYDQAIEKFVSLKKSTRGDTVTELEEDLLNSKSVFERNRFNLVNSLLNVEAKKKYEFLESFSTIMDAHLRYFKLGYDLLSQMEPLIHQVLTYAQQSKEVANIEQDKLAKRIQEFRTQAELDSVHASRNMDASTGADGRHVVNNSSYKNIEAMMQSTANGEVQTIKKGYILKRSSSLRPDWKRRFFVLDSYGTLYYYKNKGTKPMGTQSNYSTDVAEHNSSMFGLFRSRHRKSSSLCDEKLDCRRIVDLHTSTIKIDADDSNLRLCFRIISPSKTYTLQAETAAERMDWINKITGVISSLLNSHFLQPPSPETKHMDNTISVYIDSCDGRSSTNSHESLQDDKKPSQAKSISSILREVPGNDICAECSSPEPDWASLNLGILICIECSGAHRNLGVHKSKVRSITLDVKVWEPTVLNLFRTLGNGFCNSVWEELLLLPNDRLDQSNSFLLSITKPCPNDAIYEKEKYIQVKYAQKLLVSKDATTSESDYATSLWDAVKSNSLQEVYRLIVTLTRNTINNTYNVGTPNSEIGSQTIEKKLDAETCDEIGDLSENKENCHLGCSLLHLACQCGNQVMVELLLQFGADINMRDFHGKTPLHHSISQGNNQLAKFLIKRGARPSVKDGAGFSALERAMEKGAITDEELFILLTRCDL